MKNNQAKPIKNRTRIGRIERQYISMLSSIAKEIGRISSIYDPSRPETADKISRALEKYSDAIHDWAELKTAQILSDVAKADYNQWIKASQKMSESMRRSIQNAPIGAAMRELQALQVNLITSIPKQAAIRVQKLAQEAIYSGARANEIKKEIMRSGEVSAGRAGTIARTETSRASTALMQIRAQNVGSEGYIWTTSKDGDVRDSHRKMDGKFVRWDSPPTLDGLTGHAGQLPNCRCFPVPVLPENQN